MAILPPGGAATAVALARAAGVGWPEDCTICLGFGLEGGSSFAMASHEGGSTAPALDSSPSTWAAALAGFVGSGIFVGTTNEGGGEGEGKDTDIDQFVFRGWCFGETCVFFSAASRGCSIFLIV